MIRCFSIRHTVSALLLSWAMPLAAASGEAAKLLREGLPEVAMIKLREALADETLAPEAKAALEKQLAGALLEAGHAEEALARIEGLEGSGNEVTLLKGRTLAALGRWEEALASFRHVHQSAGEGRDEAAIGIAMGLRALGGGGGDKAEALDAAIGTLEKVEQPNVEVQLRLAELYLEAGRVADCEPLLAATEPVTLREKKWKQYLEARQLLTAGHPAYALGRFEALERDPQGVSFEMSVGVVFGIADSRAQLKSLSSADGVLEKYISRHPEHPKLELIFRKLDGIYAKEENFSDSVLKKWVEQGPSLRAGYALYYQAKAAERGRRHERALRLLEPYAERFPGHPMLADALLLQGELLTREERYTEAQAVLEAAMRAAGNDLQRAGIEMASAAVLFRQGEFVLAATLYRAAGERAPELWEKAVFNAALSWLHQGNAARFQENFKELSQRHPDGPYRRELILEEGLLLARQGKRSVKKAEAVLEQFVEEFPGNVRVVEAQLALAELRYESHDHKGASRYLKVIHETKIPRHQEQQAEYLAIFVADASSPEKPEKVIKLCKRFLEEHPGAAREPEVLMKLGQVYFRIGDFVSAQAQFEQLALRHPDSPLTEAASFLAGQSAIKSMSEGGMDRAIELFEEVVKLKGPLQFQARMEQAQVQNQLGRQGEAILVYDAILQADPPEEIRFAALAAKADNLSELGETKSGAWEEALAIYSRLAEEAGARSAWHGQSLYNKGRCLAALHRKDEALAAYHDVLEAGVEEPREYFWFYKAGFDAAALCEERSQWKSAIAIYQKIASLEGPRSEEAKARISSLRLEHFIWE